MATKTLYATGTFKYQSRMLKAGDPVEMTDPLARLYMALGKVTEGQPKASPKPQVQKRKPRRKAAAKK